MQHPSSGVRVGLDPTGSGTPLVLLKANTQVIPIFVSSSQATSVDMALEGERMDRPQTHDLVIEVGRALDAEFKEVRVDGIKHGTFTAPIEFTPRQPTVQNAITQDARPSDAISLALRADCPITVATGVVAQAGLDPEDVSSGLGGEEIVEAEQS